LWIFNTVLKGVKVRNLVSNSYRSCLWVALVLKRINVSEHYLNSGRTSGILLRERHSVVWEINVWVLIKDRGKTYKAIVTRPSINHDATAKVSKDF